MVKAVFDELDRPSPRRHFTVGIVDDVTGLSLKVDERFEVEPAGSVRAVFYGLGADGTVGANKNSIKIIGEETDNWAQGYFVYDSKKSGASTISHLRFGPTPIRAPYLITKASFVGCHQYNFLERYDVLKAAEPGGVFLLNAPFGPDDVWDELPFEVQDEIVDKRLRFFVIDAYGGREGRRHGHAHQHDHADVLLRDFRRPAAGAGDRARSSTRSRRPTASAAKRSSGATSRRWTRRSPACSRSPCRRRRRPCGACRRSCPTRRLIS